MVTIYTACGHKFIIPKEVACLSGFLKVMLEGVCTFKEANTGVIHLHEIQGDVFEQITRYLMQEWLFNSNPSQKRVIFSVEMPEESVMELLLACHFLDLPDLLNTTCKMLADNISRLSTLSIFPAETVQQIYKHTDPFELIQLEVNCTERNTLDGFLASPEIWKDKYSAMKWDLDRSNYLLSYLPSCSSTIDPYPSVAHCFPDIFSFFPCDTNKDINWKQEFVQRYVQRVVSSIEPNTNGGEELVAVLENCSPFVKMIKIPGHLFQAMALHKEQSNPFQVTLKAFLTSLPSLIHLEVSNFPLEYKAISAFVQISSALPANLKSLVLRNVNASNKALRLLCRLLNEHPFESLDIGENKFTHRGMVFFANALLTNSSLRCLTVYNNQYRFNNARIHLNRLPHWQREEFRQSLQTQQKTDEDMPIGDEMELELDCKFAGDALFRSMSTNETLQLLDLGCTEICLSDIALESWQAMQQNQSLQWLLLQGSSIRYEDVTENIFEYLPLSLKYLDISKMDTFDGERVMDDLSRASPRFQNLLALDVSHCYLGAQISVSSIAHLLHSIPALRSLNLTRCQIPRLYIPIIARSLEEHSSLQFLSVSCNNFGVDIAQIIEAAKRRLPQKSKLEIDISSNNVPYSLIQSFRNMLSEFIDGQLIVHLEQ